MNLSELSLKRPVLAVVCSIVIIIFGIIGYTFLGVREFPAVDPAVINVRASYTGANADIIEQQITEPLEKAINGVQGIRNITSSSAQGSSSISVEFELNVDLEKAANDVREKVSQALVNLPQDMDAPPIVIKADSTVAVSAPPVLSPAVSPLSASQVEPPAYAEGEAPWDAGANFRH